MAKELQLKVRKVWGTNFYVCRSYRRKTGRGPFAAPILKSVKMQSFSVFLDITKMLISFEKMLISVELAKLCKPTFIFVLAQKATKFRKQNFKQFNFISFHLIAIVSKDHL